MELKPEKIDIVAHTTASVLLLEAFTNLKNGSDGEKELCKIILAANPGKPIVDVCLTINGIQVPFAKTVNEAWTRSVQGFKEDAAQEFLDKITTAGLHKLQSLSEDIEWMVRDKFKAAGIDLSSRED